MALPIVRLSPGRTFYAEQAAISEDLPFLGKDEAQLRSWIASRWSEAFDGKAAETARLKRCSLYYDGFHYNDPWLNRTRPISNFCFSVVETTVPAVTAYRPRPEIMPRRSIASEKADRLQNFAAWLQSRSHFDRWVELATRDRSIYGWNPSTISFDLQSGMPYPRNLSVFDYYPDPASPSPWDVDYAFIGTPVSVTKLRRMFPDLAQDIQPDGVASPAHDAAVRPFQEHLEGARAYGMPNLLTSTLGVVKEGSPPASFSTSYSRGTGVSAPWATAFVLQLFVPHPLERKVTYIGTERREHPEAGSVEVPGSHLEVVEPISECGWCMMTMLHSGLILEMPHPVDPCYGGLPVMLGRRYPRTDRLWSPGDLDQVIPIQRSILRRDALLLKSLEVEANPPILTDTQSGLPADQDTVEGGDVLRVARGSQVTWLSHRGASEPQFDVRLSSAHDIDVVSGVHASQRGERPAGIEAAAALRRLQEAAAVRIRGMEAGAHLERSEMLKRLMVCAGRKLSGPIMFKALGGAPLTIDPEDLLEEYDIDFAEGTGDSLGRQANEDKALALFDRHAIDEEALLRALDWPDREKILARLQLQQRILAAVAAKQNGGGQGGSRGETQLRGQKVAP